MFGQFNNISTKEGKRRGRDAEKPFDAMDKHTKNVGVAICLIDIQLSNIIQELHRIFKRKTQSLNFLLDY